VASWRGRGFSAELRERSWRSCWPSMAVMAQSRNGDEVTRYLMGIQWYNVVGMKSRVWFYGLSQYLRSAIFSSPFWDTPRWIFGEMSQNWWNGGYLRGTQVGYGSKSRIPSTINACSPPQKTQIWHCSLWMSSNFGTPNNALHLCKAFSAAALLPEQGPLCSLLTMSSLLVLEDTFMWHTQQFTILPTLWRSFWIIPNRGAPNSMK
jgi:hypothetical protein